MRPFDALGERLLRAGIAPRHVRRYLRELSDHFDDIVRQDGVNAVEARTRLGNDDTLAAPILAKPELRSYAARFPWAVFGLGPFVSLIAVVFVGVLMEGGAFGLLDHFSGYTGPHALYRIPIGWLWIPFALWNGLLTLIAPLFVGAIFALVGIRQRVKTGWILFGAASVSLIGCFLQLGLRWPDGMHPGELSASFALVSPFPRLMIFNGLYRIAIDLPLLAAAYVFWLRPVSQSPISA